MSEAAPESLPWSQVRPQAPGYYWYWNGIEGNAPMIMPLSGSKPDALDGWWAPITLPDMSWTKPREVSAHSPQLADLRQVVRHRLSFSGPSTNAWLTEERLWVVARHLDSLLREAGCSTAAFERNHFIEQPSSCALFCTSNSARFELLFTIDPALIWDQETERPTFWKIVPAQNRYLTSLESATGIPSKYLKGPSIAVLLPEHPMLQELLGTDPTRSTPHVVIATYPDKKAFALRLDSRSTSA